MHFITNAVFPFDKMPHHVMEQWSFISKEQAESSPLNAGCKKTSFYFCPPQQWNCSETQVQQFNISLATATEVMTALDNNHLPIP